jgi:hypothetical protein
MIYISLHHERPNQISNPYEILYRGYARQLLPGATIDMFQSPPYEVKFLPIFFPEVRSNRWYTWFTDYPDGRYFGVWDDNQFVNAFPVTDVFHLTPGTIFNLTITAGYIK